jgi:hypothetical protein
MILDQPYRGSNPWDHRSELKPKPNTKTARDHQFPGNPFTPSLRMADNLFAFPILKEDLPLIKTSRRTARGH